MEVPSQRYNWKDIAAKIQKRQENDGWQFLFLAAGQDAIATASQMNIYAHNAGTASDSEVGVAGSQRAMSGKVRAMQEMDAASEGLSGSMDVILREEEEEVTYERENDAYRNFELSTGAFCVLNRRAGS
ncbi:MAG: hypothetical protein P1U86_21805 [Verrucomicrobiales bacterium]|nr:hypothetical protein [Verrucomicrobiales bacterium]